MKVSKKRQSRLAISRRALALRSEIGSCSAVGGEKLIHQAMSGDSAQTATNGKAIPKAEVPARNRIASTTTAKSMLAASCRTIRRQSERSSDAAWAAVV